MDSTIYAIARSEDGTALDIVVGYKAISKNGKTAIIILKDVTRCHNGYMVKIYPDKDCYCSFEEAHKEMITELKREPFVPGPEEIEAIKQLMEE